MDKWEDLGRPGYFGRRRDSIVADLNNRYGTAGWRLRWKLEGRALDFVEACKEFYEKSYFLYLKNRLDEVDFICSFGECIDNAPTNVNSGLDYTKQESFSTHIQDIAVRNALHILGRKFEGPKDKILEIRGSDSNGYRFGPGNIPFMSKELIIQPSLCPKWANTGTVEDFWQSNKILQVLQK